MAVAPFNKLAVELVIHILVLLDFETLVTCRQVSQFLRSTIDGSPLLQHELELDAAGQEEPRQALGLDIGVRSQRLKDYNSAWRHLRLEGAKVLSPAPGTLRMYRLQSGILARVYAADDGHHGLVFNKLPGPSRRITPHEWKIDSIGFCILDLLMDPAQDLLVLIDISGAVHARSLRTGKHHPDASWPQSQLQLPLTEDFKTEFSLSGNLLGVVTKAWVGTHWGPTNLLVLSWKTSDTIVHIWSRRSRSIGSLVFLNENFILLSTGGDSASMKVYDLNSFPRDLARYEDVQSYCTFAYPGFTGYSCAIQTNTPIRWTPDKDSDVPFFPAPGGTLLLVEMVINQRGFQHFIPLSLLMSRLKSGVTWEWHDWGPQGTVLQDSELSRIVPWPLDAVCGYRYVQISKQASSSDVFLEVYDFSKGRDPPVGGVVRYVHSALWPSPGGLKEIRTALCCTIKSLRVPTTNVRLPCAMISEDNVVIVERTSTETGSEEFWIATVETIHA
ncbi:hypothetical protein NEOLEDRAFT_1178035 [Neolentinus lepideus HHB14362 ss-1]|uniref:F-box domain-containing protein n=1 Tax=Neolentinus lepideus HHB14362 ss-1 TaxID=1314782 RepID=A0A165SZF0_9AGAM|nr:hypothetical protein NEOLEDRAFT_1178035 [Neolentinus lepideus HHB14362 ss-1]